MRLLALLFLLAGPLWSTPTRVLTVDNANLLVQDDYDAVYFYHLAPGYKNHLYLDYLNSGRAVGWAFLDIKVGTLAVWWNRDYSPRSLFESAASSAMLGRSLTDLSSTTTTPWAPAENFIKSPEMQVALGYGVELPIGANLGLCFQYAAARQTRDFAYADGSGNPVLSGSTSFNRYLNGGGYASNLTVTSYTNLQSGTGMLVVPMLGFYGENFGLDLKYELNWNTLANEHTEALRDPGSTMSGTVTQSLKDKGALSTAPKARLRINLDGGALVLRGGLVNQDFSTQHRQKGVFSGTGFADSDELAGFDHLDAEENYRVSAWDAMLGYVHSLNKGASLIVVGIGANGSTSRLEDILYRPRGGGATDKYNDLVRQSRSDTLKETMAVPVLMGAEIEMARWVRGRGVVQRNFHSDSRTKTQTQGFDPATGDPSSQQDASTTTDLNGQWAFAAGLGFDFGSVLWDVALNSSFLASSGGWSNPACQSSLTWGY